MISGYLVGDKQLIEKFNGANDKIKAQLDMIVQKLGFALQGKVQQDYLRGPRPGNLGVVTGRLINSITQGGADTRSRFESTATTAFAFVGTNVSYAAGWEHGFSRNVGAGSRGGSFGSMGEKAKATYFSKHPPGVKDVAARPFLAPALAEMHDLIVEQIRSGLQKAASEVIK